MLWWMLYKHLINVQGLFRNSERMYVCERMHIPCSTEWWDGHLERRAIRKEDLARFQQEKAYGSGCGVRAFSPHIGGFHSHLP